MWTRRMTTLFVIALLGLLAATAGNTADAPALEPAELIIEQWERAFTDEDDVAECVPRVKEKTGAELTEQDLADIQTYLVEGAADSERPMTCG